MYMLFAGDSYYPSGGWRDFKGTYLTEIEAMMAVANLNCDWWHLVCMGQIVRTGHRN